MKTKTDYSSSGAILSTTSVQKVPSGKLCKATLNEMIAILKEAKQSGQTTRDDYLVVLKAYAVSPQPMAYIALDYLMDAIQDQVADAEIYDIVLSIATTSQALTYGTVYAANQLINHAKNSLIAIKDSYATQLNELAKTLTPKKMLFALNNLNFNKIINKSTSKDYEHLLNIMAEGSLQLDYWFTVYLLKDAKQTGILDVSNIYDQTRRLLEDPYKYSLKSVLSLFEEATTSRFVDNIISENILELLLTDGTMIDSLLAFKALRIIEDLRKSQDVSKYEGAALEKIVPLCLSQASFDILTTLVKETEGKGSVQLYNQVINTLSKEGETSIVLIQHLIEKAKLLGFTGVINHNAKQLSMATTDDYLNILNQIKSSNLSIQKALSSLYEAFEANRVDNNLYNETLSLALTSNIITSKIIYNVITLREKGEKANLVIAPDYDSLFDEQIKKSMPPELYNAWHQWVETKKSNDKVPVEVYSTLINAIKKHENKDNHDSSDNNDFFVALGLLNDAKEAGVVNANLYAEILSFNLFINPNSRVHLKLALSLLEEAKSMGLKVNNNVCVAILKGILSDTVKIKTVQVIQVLRLIENLRKDHDISKYETAVLTKVVPHDLSQASFDILARLAKEPKGKANIQLYHEALSSLGNEAVMYSHLIKELIAEAKKHDIINAETYKIALTSLITHPSMSSVITFSQMAINSAEVNSTASCNKKPQPEKNLATNKDVPTFDKITHKYSEYHPVPKALGFLENALSKNLADANLFDKVLFWLISVSVTPIQNQRCLYIAQDLIEKGRKANLVIDAKYDSFLDELAKKIIPQDLYTALLQLSAIKKLNRGVFTEDYIKVIKCKSSIEFPLVITLLNEAKNTGVANAELYAEVVSFKGIKKTRIELLSPYYEEAKKVNLENAVFVNLLGAIHSWDSLNINQLYFSLKIWNQSQKRGLELANYSAPLQKINLTKISKQTYDVLEQLAAEEINTEPDVISFILNQPRKSPMILHDKERSSRDIYKILRLLNERVVTRDVENSLKKSALRVMSKETYNTLKSLTKNPKDINCYNTVFNNLLNQNKFDSQLAFAVLDNAKHVKIFSPTVYDNILSIIKNKKSYTDSYTAFQKQKDCAQQYSQVDTENSSEILGTCMKDDESLLHKKMLTAFHKVVQSGNPIIVDNFLSQLRHQNGDCTKLFLATTESGFNLLHFAAMSGNLGIVNAVVQHIRTNCVDDADAILGVLTRSTTTMGVLPSCVYDCEDRNVINKLMMDCYAKVSLKPVLTNGNPSTLKHYWDKIERAKVKGIFEKNVLDTLILEPDNEGFNSLHQVVQSGDLTLIRAYLEDLIPIFYVYDDINVLSLLVNAINSKGQNVLHLATSTGKLEVVLEVITFIDQYIIGGRAILKNLLQQQSREGKRPGFFQLSPDAKSINRVIRYYRGYDFVVVDSEDNTFTIEENIIYVKVINNNLAYSVMRPQKEPFRDIIISNKKVKAPTPLSLETLKPLENDILALASANNHVEPIPFLRSKEAREIHHAVTSYIYAPHIANLNKVIKVLETHKENAAALQEQNYRGFTLLNDILRIPFGIKASESVCLNLLDILFTVVKNKEAMRFLVLNSFCNFAPLDTIFLPQNQNVTILTQYLHYVINAAQEGVLTLDDVRFVFTKPNNLSLLPLNQAVNTKNSKVIDCFLKMMILAVQQKVLNATDVRTAFMQQDARGCFPLLKAFNTDNSDAVRVLLEAMIDAAQQGIITNKELEQLFLMPLTFSFTTSNPEVYTTYLKCLTQNYPPSHRKETFEKLLSAPAFNFLDCTAKTGNLSVVLALINAIRDEFKQDAPSILARLANSSEQVHLLSNSNKAEAPLIINYIRQLQSLLSFSSGTNLNNKNRFFATPDLRFALPASQALPVPPPVINSTPVALLPNNGLVVNAVKLNPGASKEYRPVNPTFSGRGAPLLPQSDNAARGRGLNLHAQEYKPVTPPAFGSRGAPPSLPQSNNAARGRGLSSNAQEYRPVYPPAFSSSRGAPPRQPNNAARGRGINWG